MSLTAEPTPVARPAQAPSTLGVGVVVWLASELMFFSGLFAAYFTLRGVNDVWPPDDVELAVARTAIATVVLLASSVTMHLAVAAAQGDDRQGAIRWLGATMALGGLFLANLVAEYAEATFQIDSHAYGSIFYLMTGFHGLHVLGGLVLMAAIMAAIVGRSLAPVRRTVDVCSYYWHFVDVVWVAMFTSIYLIR